MISVAILVILFSVQRFGTQKVGFFTFQCNKYLSEEYSCQLSINSNVNVAQKRREEIGKYMK
jgi:hypothetical protein